jgi:hypothetical protein
MEPLEGYAMSRWPKEILGLFLLRILEYKLMGDIMGAYTVHKFNYNPYVPHLTSRPTYCNSPLLPVQPPCKYAVSHLGE